MSRTRQEEREYHRRWVAANLIRARQIARLANRRAKLRNAMLRVVRRHLPGFVLP